MTDTPTPAPTLEFDLEMLIKQHDKDAYTHAHFRRMGDADFHAQTADALRWAAAEIARERARAEKAEAMNREAGDVLARFGCLAELFDKVDEHDDSVWAMTDDQTPLDLFKLVALVTARGKDQSVYRATVGDLRAARALAAKLKGEG